MRLSQNYLPFAVIFRCMFLNENSIFWHHDENFIKACYRAMGECKKDVTPVLMHWSYVFLALTHRRCPIESQHCLCNGLAPNWWQAITWTNNNTVQWRVYASQGLSELKQEPINLCYRLYWKISVNNALNRVHKQWLVTFFSVKVAICFTKMTLEFIREDITTFCS